MGYHPQIMTISRPSFPALFYYASKYLISNGNNKSQLGPVVPVLCALGIVRNKKLTTEYL